MSKSSDGYQCRVGPNLDQLAIRLFKPIIMIAKINKGRELQKVMKIGKPISLKGLKDQYDDKPKGKKCDIVIP